MSRKTTLTLSLVAAVAFAAFAINDAHACKRRYSGYTKNYYYRPAVKKVAVVHTQKVQTQHVVVTEPKVVEPELPTIPAGSTITLPANFLGNEQGNVFLSFSNIKLPVKVLKWDNNSVMMTLPSMAIKQPLRLSLDVVKPNGDLAHTQQIRMTAPPALIVHPSSPSTPLPINEPTTLPVSAPFGG